MRITLFQVFLWLIHLNTLQAQTAAEIRMDSLVLEYIDNYSDIAMDEMERSGVPASIKLAQGILESRAGTSELAREANNHFGIKCGKAWSSDSHYKHDDERDRKNRPVESCFRKYKSVLDCYADHSAFIRNPKKEYRYGFLFKLNPQDYKAWAFGLKDAGYCSVEHYAERLIFYIERYKLDAYDRLAYTDRMVVKRLTKVNGVTMVQGRSGERLLDIAQLYNLPVSNLVDYNDGKYTPDQSLSIGTWIYTQPKRAYWTGAPTFHTIEPGQTLLDVAQRYGVRLAALQKRNGLKPGQEPAPYEAIRLRGTPDTDETVMVLRTKGGTPLNQTIQVQSLQAEMDTTVSEGFIIEMLPEETLAGPIPMDQLNKVDQSIVFDPETGQARIYHTVSKGDTLYSIAQRYDVSASNLRKMNRMKNNIIRAGQILRVN